MVRFARVRLAAVLMCPPSVIRCCTLMRHNGGNTLKSQDHHEGLRALPLKAMECDKNRRTWVGVVGMQCRKQSSTAAAQDEDISCGGFHSRLVCHSALEIDVTAQTVETLTILHQPYG